MRRFLFEIGVLWVVCCGFSPNHCVWERMPDGIREGRVRDSVSVHSGSGASGVIAVTDRGAYRWEPGEALFHQVIAFPPGEGRVYTVRADGTWVGIATSWGIWESDDQGRRWQHTFNPVDERQRRSYAVLRAADGVFAGTADGVFYRETENEEWNRYRGMPSGEPVYAITACGPGCVMFTADDGVYKAAFYLDAHAERVFAVASDLSAIPAEDAGWDVMTDALTDPYDDRFVRSLDRDASSGNIVLAARNGFWISRDEGLSWAGFSGPGVSSDEIERIAFYQNCPTSHGQRAPDLQDRLERPEPEPILFLASRKGAFVFSGQQWDQIYRGLSSGVVNSIHADRVGSVFAGTDSGMAVLKQQKNVRMDYAAAGRIWEHEPSVQEVHQMVTFYADVGKEKVDSWKVLSRRKALLPSVSWQIERDVSDNYHWDTGANPDVLQEGVEGLDWSITVKWDASDLIWSTAQTSIDTRSKIMVELREDLLAQATRMYFERRRLQMEHAHTVEDAPEKWQLEIRIDELTAGLDAMTGGEFSKKLRARPRVIDRRM